MNERDFFEKLVGIFNLEGKEVEWGIIVEGDTDVINEFLEQEDTKTTKNEAATKDEVTCQPGIYIKDCQIYVDLRARRFYSTVKLPEIRRLIFPAACVTKDGKNWLVAKDGQANLTIEFPIEDLWNLYKVCLYAPWMEEEVLV